MLASNKRQEKCRIEASQHQASWSQIPPLSALELYRLLEKQQEKRKEPQQHQPLAADFVLVDVRSPKERNVSMIPQAISLEEYYNNYQRDQQKNTTTSDDNNNNNNNDNADKLNPQKVIFYCTVGYRSGLEATIALWQDPSLKGRIYNMEGILAFSHVLAAERGQEQPDKNATKPISTKKNDGDDDDDSSTNNPPIALMDPNTGHATHQLHVFGPAWDMADPSFASQMFDPAQQREQLMHVAYRTALESWYRLRAKVGEAAAAWWR